MQFAQYAARLTVLVLNFERRAGEAGRLKRGHCMSSKAGIARQPGRALRCAALIGTALVPVLAPGLAHASDWTGGTGDWFDGANWSAGVPGAGDNANIGNAGTAVIGVPGALSTNGLIGGTAGTSGAVEVNGGGTWALSFNLLVGSLGTGTLEIAGGGTVNNDRGNIGAGTTGVGFVTVDGAGSAWTNSDFLFVGFDGQGTLDITGGGAVGNTSAAIGRNTGSIGTVNVDGAGSTWISSGSLEVGEAGNGTLNITGGGAVTANGVIDIGYATGAIGLVTVDGENSSLTANDTLLVGGQGTGTLDISDGGVVENTFGGLGSDAGGAGTVTVDGPDATWTNSEQLFVGLAGDGTLRITDGGAVANTDGFVGYSAGGTGAVAVSGTGSTWTGSSLVLGNEGTGTLTVADAGEVEVNGGAGTVTVASALGSTGTVNIGAAAGDAAAAAGVLDAAALDFGSGTGTLVFNHTGTGYDFDPVISGTGAIDHRAGFTTLTGDSSAFAGTTSLQGGTLVVDGQLGGTLNVVNALLGGSGTLGATTLGSGGIVAPGNSIGTLNVAGAFDFASGSTYQVEVDDGGNAPGVNNDWIHATGAATVDSNAFVSVAPENGTDDGSTYIPGTVYTILTADGGVSGIFGGVTDSFAFLSSLLTYDANNVYLTLNVAADFQDAARTPNQFGAALAANDLGPGNPVYDEILTMTEEEARAAFDALSGEIHASARTGFFHAVQQIREALLARLRGLSGGSGTQTAARYVPAAGDAVSSGAGIWGTFYGSTSETDSDGNAASLDSDTYGFLGGIGGELGAASRIGLALGYTRSDFDAEARASSGDSDNFHLAAYAGTKLGAVDLGGTLAYSYRQVETERTVIVGGLTNNITAEYDAHTLQAAIEAGVDIERGSVTLTPFAGLAAVVAKTDSFTETGGPSALTVAGEDDTIGVSTLGLRARRETEVLALSGSLAWRHAFGDVDPASRMAFASAPASAFIVRGVPVAENALAFDAAIGAKLGEGVTLSLGYAGELASGARDHGLRAGLRIEF